MIKMEHQTILTEKKDPRFSKALKPGLWEFLDSKGEKHTWNINSVIGFGGSSLTYLANIPPLTKEFVLKEYFPFTLSENISRKGYSLYVSPDKANEWNNGLLHFQKEMKLQSALPLSSSDDGGDLFIYATDNFSANNTEYIVFDTDGSMTLKDYYSAKHNDICKNRKDKIKTDNTYLKELLRNAITVCDALSILHNKNLLHLDISDTNILINKKSKKVKITDLASAVEYSVEKIDYSGIHTSYTPSFSPIEQKLLYMKKGEKILLTPECDTYALCAVLYKCLFNTPFDPIINELDTFFEKKALDFLPLIPLCPDLADTLKMKLIKVLKRGLGGKGKRYKTANELKHDLEDLLSSIEKDDEYFNKTKLILKVMVSLVLLFLGTMYFGFWAMSERPTIQAEIDSIYSENETIEFYLTLYDYQNGSQSLTADCLDEIKTIGFDASKKSFELVDATDVSSVCKIRLENISADAPGEKSISIGKVYKSYTALGKWNKPIELEFYYGENITCKISAPSVTNVNSDSKHSVEYILEFYSPIDFEINLDTVGLCGFSSEKIVSKNLGNNTISLTFENIAGKPGNDKYFVLYESTAKGDEIHYSKRTKSPSFSIVEEEVNNSIIHVVYSILDRKLEENGYVILSPCIMNATEYNYNVAADDIKTVGFSADIKICDEDIILYNLKSDDFTKEMYININSGCIVAKNGSTNNSLSCEITHPEWEDTVIPTLGMVRITDEKIYHENSCVLYKLFISDESDFVLFNGNTEDYIELVGFEADVLITKKHNFCYINLENIKVIDDTKDTFYIKIKEGIAIDESGNLSRKITSPQFKIE